jgi:DNA polymerase-1
MTTPGDPARTLYLIDGTNNLFRAFFAIRGLRTSKGVPSNAVFGFTSMLRKVIKDHDPRYLAVAFDRPEPTFRHQAYADYKAHRPEAPPDLIAQIPHVKRACEVLGVPLVELAGYEADDLIGTLAQRAADAGFGVVIVGTDKDLLQLVGGPIVVLNPVSGEVLDAAGVERIFGVRPDQVTDVLALCGDASDNIPGVAGIGEKGAKDLIRQYGSLAGALENAAAIARKAYREGLAAHADTARLSRDLAIVRRDVPVPFDPEALRLRPADREAARDLFVELEFTTLAREFEAPALEMARIEVTVVRDAAGLREVARRLAGGPCAILVEPETDRPAAGRATARGGAQAALPGAGDPGPARPAGAIPGIAGIALAGEGVVFYIPIGHRGPAAGEQPTARAAVEALRPLLEGEKVERLTHGAKEALLLLRGAGSGIPGFAGDTRVASYLLNADRRSHDLEIVAQEIAGLPVASHESLVGSGAHRVGWAEVGIDRAAAFVGGRAAALLAIRDRLETGLRHDRLDDLYREVELPLASILADMERTGVRIDTAFLAGLSAEWGGELDRLTGDIHRLAGREFNINSPKQLGEILFDVLGLKPKRRTSKTKSFSTDADTLEDLAEDHELPRRLLDYRALQKLKSTYVDALPSLVDPATGRVHTSFNQAVAATGRLSSSDPNLQNIPIRTDRGKQIRRAFVPADGCHMLSADYSQIELRILAHLCRDPALVRAFRSGEDIHRRTAAEVFGVLPDLVTSEMRRRAKAVNFGVLYGMGAQRLARDQGIPAREAQQFIDRYFERLPQVKAWIDATVATAESQGQVRTLFNRVRHFPEIRGTDRNARQQAIRAAVNTVLQGTAADLIKMAMVALPEALRRGRHPATLLLQVHDELVLEAPVASIDGVATIVRRVMEEIHTLEVPLVVDLRAGENWLEMFDLPRSKD